MIKFNYNGHGYHFKDNILTDSTGLDVARLEPSTVQDEYIYYIDLVSNEVMHSEHENTDQHGPDYINLVGQYEAFNS